MSKFNVFFFPFDVFTNKKTEYVKFSGPHFYDKLESNSRTVKGATNIARDSEALAAILSPLKLTTEETALR